MIEKELLEDMRQICYYALGKDVTNIAYNEIIATLRKIDDLLEADD